MADSGAAPTAAVTTPVSGTDPFGAAIGKVFSDPNVLNAVGTGLGGVINAGLGAIGITQGQTPDQVKAAAAAAEAARQQQTMLLVGGGVAAVVVTIIVVVLVRRK